MRRLISLILCLALLVNALPGRAESNAAPLQLKEPIFTGMADKKLPSYLVDSVYDQLITDLDSENYVIEDVSAIYISQEYLNELAYNSQTNVFFGYTVSELDDYFEGTRYVFTVGDDGGTVVEPMQVVEDKTLDDILKNVAIGTGVILLCATVSVATAGVGSLAAVHMIFAVAAKGAVTCALSGTLISGVTSAAVKYYQTGDFHEAVKAAAVGGSEGFKWGAITGAISGAGKEANFLRKWHAKTNIKWNEAAIIQQEGRYSLDFIRTVHSLDEYNVYKNAQLVEYNLGETRVLLPKDFDFNIVDPDTGLTNRMLMARGKNPVDFKGVKFDWHHVGQKPDSPLALLPKAVHNSNHTILHANLTSSEVHIDDDTAWKIAKDAVNRLVAASFK